MLPALLEDGMMNDTPPIDSIFMPFASTAAGALFTYMSLKCEESTLLNKALVVWTFDSGYIS